MLLMHNWLLKLLNCSPNFQFLDSGVMGMAVQSPPNYVQVQPNAMHCSQYPNPSMHPGGGMYPVREGGMCQWKGGRYVGVEVREICGSGVGVEVREICGSEGDMWEWR